MASALPRADRLVRIPFDAAFHRPGVFGPDVSGARDAPRQPLPPGPPPGRFPLPAPPPTPGPPPGPLPLPAPPPTPGVPLAEPGFSWPFPWVDPETPVPDTPDTLPGAEGEPLAPSPLSQKPPRLGSTGAPPPLLPFTIFHEPSALLAGPFTGTLAPLPDPACNWLKLGKLDSTAPEAPPGAEGEPVPSFPLSQNPPAFGSTGAPLPPFTIFHAPAALPEGLPTPPPALPPPEPEALDTFTPDAPADADDEPLLSPCLSQNPPALGSSAVPPPPLPFTIFHVPAAAGTAPTGPSKFALASAPGPLPEPLPCPGPVP